MAYVVISAYEKLKKADLKVGLPNNYIFIEGNESKKLYNIFDVKSGKAPRKISSASFGFKGDENVCLFIFPEEKEYRMDGFLVNDLNKIKLIMRDVFDEKYNNPKEMKSTSSFLTKGEEIKKDLRGRREGYMPSGEKLIVYIIDLFKKEKRLGTADVIDRFEEDYGLAHRGRRRANKKREIIDGIETIRKRKIIKNGGDSYFVYNEKKSNA